MDEYQSPFLDNREPNDSEHTADAFVDNDNADTGVQNSGKEKPKKRPSRKRSNKSSSEVAPELVSAILELDKTITSLPDEYHDLLKLLVNLQTSVSYQRLIAALVSKDGKSTVIKNIESERKIMDSLDDPFKAAFELAGLEREDRLNHWLRAAAVDIEAAKSIAGTDNGRWPREWRDSQRESQGLYTLYNRIRENYRNHLDRVEEIVSSI